MDDLIERLRALSRHEHSDYSIGDEAAAALEAAREDAERYRFIAADKSPAWEEELNAAIDAAREARNG